MWALLKELEPTVTVHGFRSSFSTWAAEQTNLARERSASRRSRMPSATRSRRRTGGPRFSRSAVALWRHGRTTAAGRWRARPSFRSERNRHDQIAETSEADVRGDLAESAVACAPHPVAGQAHHWQHHQIGRPTSGREAPCRPRQVSLLALRRIRLVGQDRRAVYAGSRARRQNRQFVEFEAACVRPVPARRAVGAGSGSRSRRHARGAPGPACPSLSESIVMKTAARHRRAGIHSKSPGRFCGTPGRGCGCGNRPNILGAFSTVISPALPTTNAIPWVVLCMRSVKIE